MSGLSRDDNLLIRLSHTRHSLFERVVCHTYSVAWLARGRDINKIKINKKTS